MILDPVSEWVHGTLAAHVPPQARDGTIPIGKGQIRRAPGDSPSSQKPAGCRTSTMRVFAGCNRSPSAAIPACTGSGPAWASASLRHVTCRRVGPRVRT
jgi:hypothetical protein